MVRYTIHLGKDLRSRIKTKALTNDRTVISATTIRICLEWVLRSAKLGVSGLGCPSTRGAWEWEWVS